MIDLVRKCEEEVVGLHEFFVHWFRGAVEKSPERMARVESALGPDFAMVVPDGQVRERARVVDGIRGTYGTLPDTFNIHIQKFSPISVSDELVLVRYVEAQEGAGAPSRRISTAAFMPDVAAPCGVSWHWLHETWLAPSKE